MFDQIGSVEEFQLKWEVVMTAEEQADGVVLQLRGRPDACEAAQEALLASLVFIIAEVSIPWKKHYLVIGKKGESINQLRSSFTKRFNIRLPRFELQYDIIEVSGNDVDQIEQVIATMKQLLAVKEAQWEQRMAEEVTVELHLPYLYHGLVIGRGGQTIKKLRSDWNVRIMLPSAEDDLSDTIRIRGKESDCLAARLAITQLKGIPQHYVQVELAYIPRNCPHVMRTIESSMWALNDTFDVESLFAVVEGPQPKAIAVIGAKENSSLAQCQLAKQQLEMLWPVVRQVPALPHQLRLVIGRSGETIRKIRFEHQVTVLVPRKDEAHHSLPCCVTLIGSLANVDAAQAQLLNILSWCFTVTEAVPAAMDLFRTSVPTQHIPQKNLTFNRSDLVSQLLIIITIFSLSSMALCSVILQPNHTLSLSSN